MAEQTFFFTLLLVFLSPFLSSSASQSPISPPHSVCVIGAGIGGASLAHFIKTYSPYPAAPTVQIFEKSAVVGGRTATITFAGDTFEAGGSVIHPKNLNAVKFAEFLKLRRYTRGDDVSSLGVWDGERFVFKTISSAPDSKFGKIISFINSVLMFKRYGLSLIWMERFVVKAVECFSTYYKDLDSRPIFSTVEEMLKWSGLYPLTGRTLQEELADAGLSQRLISELVTVITRVNYGQNVTMSGLAGAVSLAGSSSGLWSVEGGNWQLASGLINHSNALLHLNEEITSVFYTGGYYELNSTKGNSYSCEVTVVATPLDELNISFSPPISIPKRKLQHTHATFVRGLLNPAYFGLNSGMEIPDLVGTIEAPGIPFSSIGVQKKYSEDDKAYKVFSRSAVTDELLDRMFSVRKETVRINWAAYPHFEAPEEFAPFVLDGIHLYYINAFENAASTIETSSVAAENVARLILSRLSSESPAPLPVLRNSASDCELHLDL